MRPRELGRGKGPLVPADRLPSRPFSGGGEAFRNAHLFLRVPNDAVPKAEIVAAPGTVRQVEKSGPEDRVAGTGPVELEDGIAPVRGFLLEVGPAVGLFVVQRADDPELVAAERQSISIGNPVGAVDRGFLRADAPGVAKGPREVVPRDVARDLPAPVVFRAPVRGASLGPQDLPRRNALGVGRRKRELENPVRREIERVDLHEAPAEIPGKIGRGGLHDHRAREERSRHEIEGEASLVGVGVRAAHLYPVHGRHVVAVGDPSDVDILVVNDREAAHAAEHVGRVRIRGLLDQLGAHSIGNDARFLLQGDDRDFRALRLFTRHFDRLHLELARRELERDVRGLAFSYFDPLNAQGLIRDVRDDRPVEPGRGLHAK